MNTRGQKTRKGGTRYRVVLPDGRKIERISFKHTEAKIPATAQQLPTTGVFVGLWPDGNAAWSGDFGPLVAKRVREKPSGRKIQNVTNITSEITKT